MFLAAWSTSGNSALAQPPPGAPNIVFILTDDLGYGDTGVTGQNARKALNNPNVPYFETPNIDSIALQGARFEGMYSGSNTCAPSRAVLMTGFDVGHIIVDRVDKNSLRGDEADQTWGQVLQNAGYETGWFGKWHLSGGPIPGFYGALPTQKGFETGYGPMTGTYRTPVHYESNGSGGVQAVSVPSDPSWPGPGGPYAYGEDIVADRAELFIRQKAGSGEPFAAYVAFQEPHANVSMVPQDHPYVNMPWPKADRDYAGIMARLDAHVGQILDALADPNGDNDTSDSIVNNTLLIFTSDNGVVWDGGTLGFTYEFFDSNGIYSGHKWKTEEGGIKVPFFARWGGTIAPGTVNTTYKGSFEDIMPTFAELAGQDAPLGIDGRSMLSDLVGGPPSDRRDSLMWFTERGGFANSPLNYAVQVANWKLVVRQASTSAPDIFPTLPYKLYNLAADPSEANNLMGTRPDIVAALQSIIIAEGGLREATLPWFNEKPPSNPSQQPESVNSYYTQYKAWAPQASSTDFHGAANWSGGTQYWYANTQPVEAQNWNTGPADNWLTTMDNSTGAAQEVTLSTNADVLAIELRGTSEMKLAINAGSKLSARNGLRISNGGVLRLHGGEVNTIRDLEVRPGGRFDGEGLVNGQQAVIAGIPEFAGLGLFEPRVVNRGIVSVVSDNDASLDAGRLLIKGDYVQAPTGTLQLSVFDNGPTAGFDFDQLSATGKVTLGGSLQIATNPLAGFALGDSFTIITADAGLTGIFSSFSAPAINPSLSWAIQYTANAATLKVVQHIGLGGPFDYLTQFYQSFGVNGNADLDGDGDSDGVDFLVWQRTSASASSSASAVPEPSAVALSALAFAWMGSVSRMRRRPIATLR